jgi:glycosyltransferase involved in cell wall biosynthesis
MSGRALHVIPSVAPVHGGPSAAIRLIEQALDASNWRSETATSTDGGHGQKLERPTASLVREEGANRWYFARNTEFYKVAWSFIPWIRRHVADYDVVHIHALFSFMSVVAALAARRAGVPYVVRPLGVLNQYGVTRRRPWLKRVSLNWIEGPILESAAAVHFTAEAECEEALALGLRMRHVIIPLGFDLSTHQPAGVTEDGTARSGHEPQLLFLSRLDPIKNLEGLIDAVALMRSRGIDASVKIAGDGAANYVSGLKARAADRGVAKHFSWLGYVSGEVKARLLKSTDIFVLPSHSENFGVAVLEAMAAGMPCVVGRGVALATMLQKAGAGIAVDTSAEGIATGIQHYLDSEAERRRAGVAARELAEREFSMETMSKRLVDLYETVRNPRRVVQRVAQ